MFEPKRKWFNEIDWEDRTVLLKGILSIKEEDYGRFTELALDAGMGEALAEESGECDRESKGLSTFGSPFPFLACGETGRV